MEELLIKKCAHCGAIIKVMKDCKDGIQCCGEEMKTLVPNSVDAAVEKHVPTYEIKDNKILVKVNHVMEEDHYIEWVTFKNGNKEKTVYFKPGDEAIVKFCYHPGTVIYAYCNKHGLWKNVVE